MREIERPESESEPENDEVVQTPNTPKSSSLSELFITLSTWETRRIQQMVRNRTRKSSRTTTKLFACHYHPLLLCCIINSSHDGLNMRDDRQVDCEGGV